jgi:hypothetical protein
MVLGYHKIKVFSIALFVNKNLHNILRLEWTYKSKHIAYESLSRINWINS